jgi:acetyl-CoA carboxylase carboxyl transferase subunit alpha
MSDKVFLLPFERPIYELEMKLEELEGTAGAHENASEEIRRIRQELDDLREKVFANLTAWETVQVARHKDRPQTQDYIELIFDEFTELHGDRAFGDDRAIVTGFAKVGDYRVLVVGHSKGKNLKERSECYYGCAHPEGYRKALLKMKLAAKYRLPIICLIDTPGAFPGIGAEERGQSMAIAINLLEMSRLETPIICTVIGEGGSGGALGIGIGDRVAMLQHAYYSVISPEGCSGILWKNADENKTRAAEVLKLTSGHLKRLGVIDDVIPEPPGGAHRDHRGTAFAVKNQWLKYLRELTVQPIAKLLDERYAKFRRMGVFESQPAVAAQTLTEAPSP